MADDNGFGDLAQFLIQSGGNLAGNEARQKAYEAIIKNLGDRFNDYKNLAPAGYQNITAQQLGPSALSNIGVDEQSRLNQQAAISELGDVANRGGLNLADMAALNKIQGNLNRNAQARNSALANQFAARGQLGSGAQLAMSLANNQNAAMNANEAGESQAAQAQQRALQAILQKAQMSRTMSQDDYAKKKAAAEAADAIARYNANARTDAGKYNNTVAGQAYADQLNKLKAETGLTSETNQTLLGRGNQTAANAVGMANAGAGLVNSLGKLGSSGGGGGGGGSGSGSTTSDSGEQPGSKLTDEGGQGTGSDAPVDPAPNTPEDFNSYPVEDTYEPVY